MGNAALAFRLPEPEDVLHLADRLRAPDVDEAWAALKMDPYEALLSSWGHSEYVLTVLLEGEPAAMFGVCRMSDSTGQLWMLAGEVFGRRPRPFLRATRTVLRACFEHYSVLTNFVDARHVESLRLLRFLGAEIAPAKPFGPLKLPFHRFEIRRPSCA